MNNFLLYKNIKGQNINIKFVYEPYICLCGDKYIASQLKVVVSGLNGNYKEDNRPGYKDFFIDRDDWALKNNIDSNESDDELKSAEIFFNCNENITALRKNRATSYLLEQIDIFLEKL